MRHTSGLYGGFVPSATAQTPYPTTGLQDQRSVETAQIVLDDPDTPAGEEILAYCIQLDTQTTIGIHYELGTWTEANVPNLPYVQWILEHYYPSVPTAPAGTTAEQVRAVQGAIWYFTDQFVVNRFYPAERNAVRAIVEAAQAALGPGPTPPEPDLPTLTITPAALEGAVTGDLVGPFAVGGDVASATIDITGTRVYRDAAGSVEVLDGETVVPGEELWAEFDASVATQGFDLTAYAPVPAGNVYLYDGNNPPIRTAQTLVLAATTTVPVRASATVLHPETATLSVDVVIAGAAAGRQSEVRFTATCTTATAVTLEYVRIVAAGSPAGTYAFDFPDIPADDTVCSVVQDADGSNAAVDVSTTIDPASVTLSSSAPQTITVTDTYSLVPGDFRLDVEIGGPAAGDQSALLFAVSCVGPSGTSSVTYPVAAGASGTVSAGTLPGLENGTTCHASLTEDGDNAGAELVSAEFDPYFVEVPPGGVGVILATLAYDVPVPATGTLAVDVTVAGPAAGRQSAIEVLASCAGGPSAAFTLPAGATGTHRVGVIGGVPVGTECAVTQASAGENADAELASATIVPATVTIADATTAIITVTDTYVVPTPPSGSFQVVVAIAGAAAGAQGAIGVEARCGTGADAIAEPFTIPAGAAAGAHVAGTVPEVPVGFECTAVLTADGANADATLSASTVVPSSDVIADGVLSAVTITNTYAVPSPGPSPSPTPSPTPAPMPATGGGGSIPWGVPLALLLGGLALAAIPLARRRRA